MTRKYVQLVQIEIDGILVDAKECTKCGVVKSLDEYNAKKNGLGKKASACKDCMLERRKQTKHLKSEYDKIYREKNIDKLLKKVEITTMKTEKNIYNEEENTIKIIKSITFKNVENGLKIIKREYEKLIEHGCGKSVKKILNSN
ncbi:hypothetical protein [Bacillus thuringiensis]|uniref:hypothetical protein n=1 Tax=Bacillus thuringiensis TaxID=1428 RepID=UPI000BFBD316|nr:hypothetical protein [Bacillus thuringiensis]PGM02691.1 hypothetical protein CN938_30790 [Bacillus thuringiensis]